MKWINYPIIIFSGAFQPGGRGGRGGGRGGGGGGNKPGKGRGNWAFQHFGNKLCWDLYCDFYDNVIILYTCVSMVKESGVLIFP